MPLIQVDEVQSWFTEDRLSLEHDDTLPEEANVSEMVRSRLADTYDVTTWVSVATTPTLVRKVIAAKVAAIRYSKHYADQLDELPYAEKLEMWAKDTLEAIAEGKLTLLDVVTDAEQDAAEEARSISFFPTDVSSIDEPAKFTMGEVF